jgi:hypothetical protein
VLKADSEADIGSEMKISVAPRCGFTDIENVVDGRRRGAALVEGYMDLSGARETAVTVMFLITVSLLRKEPHLDCKFPVTSLLLASLPRGACSEFSYLWE